MHYPAHVRAAFLEWLAAGQPPSATVEVEYVPTEWPARKLLGRMTHCTDILPGIEGREYLDVPSGTTYAAAAQRLLRERREVSR